MIKRTPTHTKSLGCNYKRLIGFSDRRGIRARRIHIEYNEPKRARLCLMTSFDHGIERVSVCRSVDTCYTSKDM